MLTNHTQRDQSQSPSTASIPSRRHQADLDQIIESALIHRVANQDDQAFEVLYTCYAPRIRAYIQRRLSDCDIVNEVLNDVMMVFWRDAARVPPSVPLMSWLFGIARLHILRVWSKTSRHARLAHKGLEETAPITPESDLLYQEHFKLVRQFLNRLAPDQRQLLELAIDKGLSYEEIARQTRINVNTIKSRLFRVRRRLHQYMSTQGDTHGSRNIQPTRQLVECSADHAPEST